jgi:sugar phosphate isomerase/epimerase
MRVVNISATSVMIPQYDMRETAELLARLGFDGVEWRCRHIPEGTADSPYSPWGNVKNDFSPNNLAVRGEELRAVSEEFGLRIVGLATAMSATELDEVRKVAAGCAQWGIPMFRVQAPRAYNPEENYRSFLADTIRAFTEALKVTREYGVRIILEIHRGTVATSASQAYLVVREFDPKELGVIFDIANMSLGQGYEPTSMGLDLLGDYVAHVHAGGGRAVPGDKGEFGQTLYTWETVDLADSIIDVPAFCRQLQARNYQGFLSVEDFRDMDLEEKLSVQLAFLRAQEA